MGDTEYERLKAQLSEVLPKTGLVYSERGPLTEVLCKPKIMPLKSAALIRQEVQAKQAVRVPLNATASGLWLWLHRSGHRSGGERKESEEGKHRCCLGIPRPLPFAGTVETTAGARPEFRCGK